MENSQVTEKAQQSQIKNTSNSNFRVRPLSAAQKKELDMMSTAASSFFPKKGEEFVKQSTSNSKRPPTASGFQNPASEKNIFVRTSSASLLPKNLKSNEANQSPSKKKSSAKSSKSRKTDERELKVIESLSAESL